MNPAEILTYIPDLSYEEFLDFHRTYYHPSNSYIYLYGNMDMVEKLDFIDKHYLSAYDSLNVDSEIREQKPFAAMQDLTMEYPVAESEGEEDNAYLSYNVVVGTAMDSLTSIAFEVLDYALLSAPGAPLKQALLDAGIGKDIYGAYEDGIRQPYFDIIAKGANAERKKTNLFPLSAKSFRMSSHPELTRKLWKPESTAWNSATEKQISLPIRRD